MPAESVLELPSVSDENDKTSAHEVRPRSIGAARKSRGGRGAAGRVIESGGPAGQLLPAAAASRYCVARFESSFDRELSPWPGRYSPSSAAW